MFDYKKELRFKKRIPKSFQVHSNYRSVQQRIQSFSGLTFYKDYANSQSSANADISVGSATATVTAARSVSAPGTYFNSTGGILSLTTANVPRWTQGYYDRTGFHLRPGLMVESGGTASTGRNVVIQSQTFSDAAWTATNVTVNDAESDGTLTTTVSSITATASNGTLTQAFVLGANIFTGSIFIKRKTGTGTISLRANTADSYTDITENVGSYWTRVSVTSSSAANPTFDLKISTSGDAVYIYGAQIEQFPYMTSHIPTLTAARTRASELVTYSTGNRTASAETIVIKFTPFGDFANDGIQRVLTNSSTTNRQMYKGATDARIRMAPNLTDNSGVTALSTSPILNGVSHVFIGGANHNLPLPYSRIYVNGALENDYTSGDWTDPTFGSTFTLGSTTGAASQANGIFEAMAFYSNFKDQPEANNISSILKDSIPYNSYTLLPDTATSSNVVSGGSTGNTLTNTVYDFNGHLLKTDSDTVLKFDVEGSDADYALGLRYKINVRAFTISSSSWGSESTSYDLGGGSGFNVGSRIYRIVGSQIWMYMSKHQYPGLTNSTVVLVKSTDLTGTSWGAESTIIPLQNSIIQVCSYVETSDPDVSYLIISKDVGGQRINIRITTDGGNTFTQGPIIYSGGAQQFSEGNFVMLSDGRRMIGVLRDDAGNYVYQVNSSDAGATWTAPFSTGLGGGGDICVTPKLILSAGTTDRLTLFFYDRDGDRTKISSANHEDDAFNNNWKPVYLLGTDSNGNGDICVINDTTRQYLAYVADPNGAATDTLWWVWKDIYFWATNGTLVGLASIPGLKYYKDFERNPSIVPDYPSGGSLLSFESNYDSTHPATYCESNGTITTVTVNDQPRYTNGYYDETGFVITKGLLIDGAGQNLAARSSNFSTFWTLNNITVGGSVTLPDGTTGTTNTLTATSSDATIRATTTIGSAARQFSVWLKRKTGGGDIQLSLDNSTFKTVAINSSTWTRVWVRQTLANPTWTIRIRTSGDEIYAYGAQVMGYPFNVSYVPTTTASLSKTADVLSLPISGILSETASTVLLQFFSLSDENQNGSNAAALFDTDTKSTLLQLNSNVYPVRFQPNATDSSGSIVTSYAGISKGKYTVAAVSYGATETTNSTVYVNGTEQLASTSNYTAPAYGTNMYFGCNNASARQPAIILKRIAIYNRALSATEVASATSAMEGSWEALKDTRPKILTLGDSITNGTGQTNTWGYRAYLQELINPAVANVRTARTYQFVGPYRNTTLDDDYELFHAGVSGERTDQLALRLPTHLRNYMSGTLPVGSKALIHIGTNDITSGVAEATIVNNIKAMIDVIHAFNPAIDVYVALIIPRLDADDADTTTFNAALKLMLDAKRLTKTNLHYVDMNARWKANASWATDYIAAGSPWLNVHPLDLGYSVMADGWYACFNNPSAQYCNGN